MPTTFTVFSLGQLDVWGPTEGDRVLSTSAVDAALGTYGTVGDPIYRNTQEFSPTGTGFSGGSVSSYDIDNNASNDQFSVDGGPVQSHDATMVFDATITYMDGTTATITAVVFQDTIGNTYWAPEIAANADQAAITAQAIRSIELISPIYRAGSTNEGYNLRADRQDDVPLCFSRGALINCPGGPRAIEDLVIGDLVSTQDHGPIPIRWIGHRALGKGDFKANLKLLPVRILAGALGDGLPIRDLVVSRQHRVLIESKIAKRMFGDAEVLIPAIKLTALPGIFVDEAVESIEYFHLLFDEHEVVAPTESLFTGPEALKSVSVEAREEILTILPEIADLDYTPKSARLIPSGQQQKSLIQRHLKNNKALISSVL